MRDYFSNQLKVALVTDVFPPRSGGSGWSTYYLGKALADRGHIVRVVRPVYGTQVVRPTHKVSSYGGLPVDELYVPSSPRWTLRAGIGRAWEEQKAIRLLKRRCARLSADSEVDVFHGQHQVSGIAATLSALAARRQGQRVISVVTVRDYWPLCPSSTRLFPARSGKSEECGDCHNYSKYMSCLSNRGKRRAARLIDMARWLRTRAQSRMLAKADAVIAVSNYVRSELERSGRFSSDKLHTIHNLVDPESVDKAVAQGNEVSKTLDGRYALFAGKLDENKGAQLLPEVMEASGIRLPVLLAGDGPLQSLLQFEAERRGLDFRFLDWLDNDALLRLMRDARCLLFPSCWQEPLSRVLLEGCAAGAAIVALDSGGTSDVITHSVSGWLAHDTAGFIEGVRLVCTDDKLNETLRHGARQTATTTFSAPVVAHQLEDLYVSLLTRLGAS